MHVIHFETTVKDGYIKLPERYIGLNNKKVIVDIANKQSNSKEKTARVKNVKKFIHKCSGILKDGGFPTDLTIKNIRKIRLNEEYGLKSFHRHQYNPRLTDHMIHYIISLWNLMNLITKQFPDRISQPFITTDKPQKNTGVQQKSLYLITLRIPLEYIPAMGHRNHPAREILLYITQKGAVTQRHFHYQLRPRQTFQTIHEIHPIPVLEDARPHFRFLERLLSSWNKNIIHPKKNQEALDSFISLKKADIKEALYYL